MTYTFHEYSFLNRRRCLFPLTPSPVLHSLRFVPYSDPNERAYFWVADPDSVTPDLLDTPLTSRMYIDAGEVVRVRVEADEFYDDEPGPPKAQEGVMVNGQAKEREGRRAPYTITVRHSFTDCIARLDEIPDSSVPSPSKVLVPCRGGRTQGWRQWTRKVRSPRCGLLGLPLPWSFLDRHIACDVQRVYYPARWMVYGRRMSVSQRIEAAERTPLSQEYWVVATAQFQLRAYFHAVLDLHRSSIEST